MFRAILTVAVLGCLFAFSAALSLQEQQALVDIANAYPVLKNLTSGRWNISAPERACQDNWSGAVCFGGVNVTYMSLQGLPLNAPLPPAIGNLTALTTLNILSCGVNGTIPNEIFRLPLLRTLWISQNPLTGTIPDVSGLPKLRELYLSFLGLSGPIPDSIGSSSIETLNLVSLNISSIPDSLGNLANLTALYLQGSAWSGSIPAALFNLPRLADVTFSGPFSGSLPARVSLPNLKKFQIENTKLSGPLPVGFSAPTETIYFSSNSLISGTLPAEWGSITTLKELAVTRSPLVYGEVPASYAALSGLTKIALSTCALNRTLPPTLFDRMVNLTNIDLTSNDFTGPFPGDFRSFSRLTKLTSLSILSNRFSGPASLFLALPAISQLYIYRNQFSGPLEILAGIPTKLTSLDASNNLLTKLPDNIGAFPLLSNLRATNNRLSGTVPASLGTSASLTVVDLGYNTLTGDLPNFRRDKTWQNIIFRSNLLSYCFIEPPSVGYCYLDQNPNLCVCGRSACLGNTCANCTVSSDNRTCTLPPKPNGFPTAVPSRCESGISSNGHCCGTTCSQCESCASGNCTAVPDGPFVGCSISCTSYVAGWNMGTCNFFRDDLIGNCSAGVCNANISRCLQESALAQPSANQTCGSSDCQRTSPDICAPFSPKTSFSSLSSICYVDERGSCPFQNCDSQARCTRPAPVGSPGSPGNTQTSSAAQLAVSTAALALLLLTLVLAF